ncbi:sodium:proton antiporter [Arenibaculum sp.]|uniref:cation:proton antiporter n=1 Tax=Arenibaculum sp. TaxID=2865862 RepID=UPI002E0D2987|nr:sodium:proton antiporter [Arenibaculum sp.]
MTPFDIAAILLGTVTLFAVLNHHFLRLPLAIGLVIIALVSSFAVIALDRITPLTIDDTIRSMLVALDFEQIVMTWMLPFLLFAGALRVDVTELANRKWTILTMATIGVAISTLVIGLGFAHLAGVPLMVALVFGAIATPTDPVAVLSILQTSGAPKSLESKIVGESLFNDGVAVVVFLGLTAATFGTTTHSAEAGIASTAVLFLQEVLGGVLLGLLGGYAGYRLVKTIDDFFIEFLLTLALVFALGAGAHALHVSGPLAVVVAGLFMGNHGARYGMSEETWRYVDKSWFVIDELLNVVLFTLIGLEIFAIDLEPATVAIALLAIPLSLAGRFAAVALPITILSLGRDFTRGSVPALTWGGLKGGVSVALALSLPESEYKPLLLAAVYAVVIFSIIVQGLTLGPLVRRVMRPKGPPLSEEP